MTADPLAPVPAGQADRSAAFLALLPAIRIHARAAFRTPRSAHDREDAEAEVVARARERFAAAPAPAATAGRLAGPAVAAVRADLARSTR